MAYFFVYGTLLPGQPNEHYWGDAAVQFEPAILDNAILFDMGGFPMLIERPGCQVIGALVTADDAVYEELLVQLDRLETYNPDDPANSIYLRVKRAVQTESREQTDAWVYVGKEQYVRGMEPFGGDWIAYSAANQSNIEAWWERFNDNPDATLIELND